MQINPNDILEKKILIPCKYTKVAQVGIDLTLSDFVYIQHGGSLNVLLNEVVHLPNDVFATFTHRSTYNRQGILITGSIYDPGYEGVVGCTIYNLSGEDITIPKNERVGQMLFFYAQAASKYSGQYNKEGL